MPRAAASGPASLRTTTLVPPGALFPFPFHFAHKLFLKATVGRLVGPESRGVDGFRR